MGGWSYSGEGEQLVGGLGHALQPCGEGLPGAGGDVGIQAWLVSNQEQLHPCIVGGGGSTEGQGAASASSRGPGGCEA